MLVRKIAAELEIPVQELRRYLIDHLDMMLLEISRQELNG